MRLTRFNMYEVRKDVRMCVLFFMHVSIVRPTSFNNLMSGRMCVRVFLGGGMFGLGFPRVSAHLTSGRVCGCVSFSCILYMCVRRVSVLACQGECVCACFFV